jgi:hypothetical protein
MSASANCYSSKSISVSLLFFHITFSNLFLYIITYGGTRYRSWLRHCATICKVACSSPNDVDFSSDLILSAAPWPWGWLSLKQNWVPGTLLGVKGGRRVRLTILPPSVSQLARENVGASTSQNPMGLCGLLQGFLKLFYLSCNRIFIASHFPPNKFSHSGQQFLKSNDAVCFPHQHALVKDYEN